MLTNVFQCMSSNIYIEHSVRQYGQGIRWDICSFIQCCAVLCCAAHGEVQLKLMLSLSGLLLDVINFVVSLLKVIFYATH